MAVMAAAAVPTARAVAAAVDMALMVGIPVFLDIPKEEAAAVATAAAAVMDVHQIMAEAVEDTA